MSVGKIIGRIAIKVLPDTTSFYSDTKEDLEETSKKLGSIEVKVEPKVDPESRKVAKKEIKAFEKEVSPVTVRVNFDVNKKSLAKVQAVAQALDGALAALKTKVELDLDGVDLAKITAQLKALEAMLPPVKVPVTVDTDKDLDVDHGTDGGKSPQFTPVFNQGAFNRVRAQIANLTRKRDVEIAPVINRTALNKASEALSAMSGLRFMRAQGAKFREELMNLDLALPKIAAVSHAVAGLGAWILSASGNLFSLSASLSQIAGVGLAIPGLLGGIAIGLGATVAALKDFNTYVPQAAGMLSQLQQVISGGFWDQAAGSINNLVNTVFPLLKTALADVGVALGGFFASLSQSTESILLPSLPGMFASLTESINVSSGFTDAFVKIIERLGTIGASYLPRLAQWVGEVATNFASWLESANAIGMIEQGITVLGQLGSSIVSVFQILGNISKAALEAGGSTVGTLAERLKQIADITASPAFQEGLTATFRTAFEMMNQIATIAGPNVQKFLISLSELFQKLGPTIGDTIGTALSAITGALSSPALGAGLSDLFAGINSAVHALAPAMEPLAEKLGAVASLAGTLAANLGPVLATAIEVLAPVIGGIVEAAKSLIEALGPALQKVMAALQPVFAKAGELFSRLGAVLGPLISMIGEIIVKIVDFLAPAIVFIADIWIEWVEIAAQIYQVIFEVIMVAIQALIDIFGGLIDGILAAKEWIVDAWNTIKQGISDAVQTIGALIEVRWNQIKDKAAEIWNGIKEFFVALWEYLKFLFRSAVDNVTSFLSNAWQSIKDTASAVWNGIKNFFSSIWNGIKSSVTSVVESIKSGLSSAWNSIKSTVSSVWSTIKNSITGAIDGAWDVISGLPGKIKGVFADAGSWLFDAGKWVVEGLWNGIKNLASWVIDKIVGWAGDLVDGVADFLGISSPSKVFKQYGIWLMQGMGIGIDKSASTAVTSAMDAAVGISEGFQGALKTPDLTSTVTGMVDGLRGGYDAVAESLGHLVSSIGTVAVDTAPGTEIGEAIGGNVLTGLTDSKSLILSEVASLSDDIATELERLFSQELQVSASGDITSNVERYITTAARGAESEKSSSSDSGSLRIDNISIPLEDLAQLKDLEEFMKLLRVRIRQGVA